MYAKAVGEIAADYLETLRPEEILVAAESRALQVIAGIKAVLDDDTLDDPACFRRVESIIGVFEKSGLSTTRHDWG